MNNVNNAFLYHGRKIDPIEQFVLFLWLGNATIVMLYAFDALCDWVCRKHSAGSNSIIECQDQDVLESTKHLLWNSIFIAESPSTSLWIISA